MSGAYKFEGELHVPPPPFSNYNLKKLISSAAKMGEPMQPSTNKSEANHLKGTNNIIPLLDKLTKLLNLNYFLLNHKSIKESINNQQMLRCDGRSEMRVCTRGSEGRDHD